MDLLLLLDMSVLLPSQTWNHSMQPPARPTLPGIDHWTAWFCWTWCCRACVVPIYSDRATVLPWLEAAIQVCHHHHHQPVQVLRGQHYVEERRGGIENSSRVCVTGNQDGFLIRGTGADQELGKLEWCSGFPDICVASWCVWLSIMAHCLDLGSSKESSTPRHSRK